MVAILTIAAAYAWSAMGLILVALFIVLPIAEIYVIIQVGDAIGVLPTIALLIVDGMIGVALLRSQGRRAIERFNGALEQGRVPAREVFDGTAIMLGGALMLAPGFITDIFALCLLLPPTRDLIRIVGTRLGWRGISGSWRIGSFGSGPSGGPGGGSPPGFGSGTRRRYDYEGTAQEVVDPTAEIEDGGDDAR